MEIVKNFTRKDLVRRFGRLGLNKGVEVGTCTGSFAKRMCRSNKKLKLKTVDPFNIVYREHRTEVLGKKAQNDLFLMATARLEPYNCEIVRKTSLEAVREIPYESLDFVYIDGSHQFDYVMTDIIEWAKRVRTGGIVSGHDYKSYKNDPLCDVEFAVDIYARMHKLEKVYLTDEASPSWWFIKNEN